MRWLVSAGLCTAFMMSDHEMLSIFSCQRLFWEQHVSNYSFLRSASVRTARVCPQWSLKGTNDNQLIIFLLANVCVGAVNISIRTLLQPAVVVWFIMTSYMLILFICAHRLGVAEKRIRIL